MIENTLWVERFRPKTLDGYIGNENLISKIKSYIDTQDVPHLLLHGPAGTGKTTLAKIIANSIDCDLLYINASDENNVDTVRDKIKGFASTASFKTWKIIILDESDFLTSNAQAALRALMETFSAGTRFILTCNYPQKIIPAIMSRCQDFEIHPPSKAAVAVRIMKLMDEMSVSYEKVDLVKVVEMAYPDVRKILGLCQRNVRDSKLTIPSNELSRYSYLDEIIAAFKGKANSKDKYSALRQIVIDTKLRDFTPVYRYLFDHLNEFATGKQAEVILAIAESQYQDAFVVDKEIHISALFIKIIGILNGQ